MRTLMLSAALALSGLAMTSPEAHAEEAFTGQVHAYGFDYCPINTTTAGGQLLPISQYQALFSLYGNSYGGDGITTFGVPNMQGTRFVGRGSAPGVSHVYDIGDRVGSESLALTEANMPRHNHAFNASSQPNASNVPAGRTFATFSGVNVYAEAGENDTQMNVGSVGQIGGGQAITLLSPFLAVNYCVTLTGLYPSRP